MNWGMHRYYCSVCGSHDKHHYIGWDIYCKCCKSMNTLKLLSEHEKRIIINVYTERQSYERELNDYLNSEIK